MRVSKTLCRSKVFLERHETDTGTFNRIKKPKTHRYPSLNGTDPKFRRNHRHALHGTMRALVFSMELLRREYEANSMHRKRSRREREKRREHEKAERCSVAELRTVIRLVGLMRWLKSICMLTDS